MTILTKRGKRAIDQRDLEFFDRTVEIFDFVGGMNEFSELISRLSQLIDNLSDNGRVYWRLVVRCVRVGSLTKYRPVYERDQNEKVLRQGLSYFQLNHHEQDTLYILSKLGDVMHILGRLQEGLGYRQEALRIAYNLEDASYIAYLTNGIAGLVGNMGNYEQCYNLFLKGLTLFRQIGSKDQLITTLATLSYVTTFVGKESEIVKYIDEALRISQEYYLPRRLTHIYGYGRRAMHFIGDWMKAKEYSVLYHDLAKDLGRYDLILGAKLWLIRDHTLQCEFTLAETYIQEAKQLVPDWLNLDELSANDIMNYYTGTNQLDLARHFFWRSLKHIKEIKYWIAMPALLVNYALLEAYSGFEINGVEMMGLAMNDNQNSSFTTTPLYKKWLAHVKSELTEDEFEQAWERGKAFDAEQVVEDLLAQFESDEDDESGEGS